MADRSLRLPRIAALSGLVARSGTLPGAGRALPAFPRPRPRVSLRPADLLLFAWRTLWSPFWIGSDVPAPWLPERNLPVPAGMGLAGDQVVRVLDRLRRRTWILWALTTLVRSAWLGGLVGCGWLLLERGAGPAFRVEPLLWIGGALVAGGVVFAAVNRPTRRQTARMLDRSFRLHERISTALDNLGKGVPEPGERAQVVYLQVADAANVIAEMRRHPAFRLRPPLRELVLALTCALLLAGLFFLRGIGGGIPDLSAANVPVFSPASTRIKPPQATGNPGAVPGEAPDAPTSEEVQARAQRSNEAQRDLSTLGQALDDHAVTRSAAEAIAQGDYDEAAEELREVAGQADQMSEESRQALADDLDQAAEQMSSGSSELSEASRTAADGLREGGEPAQQGVNELGDAVQETGGEVASQQELREQMTQAQAQESSSSEGQNGAQEGDAGQQAGDQTGEAGGEQSEGDPRQGEGGEGEQAGSGEGQNGDPSSEGADAAPGDGGQQPSADRGNNPGGTRDSGRGEQRGRNRPASSEGAPAEGEPGAQGGSAGQPPSQPSADGDPSDAAQQGDGAGAGQGETRDSEMAQGGESTGEQSGSEGLPAEEQVTESQPPAAGEEQPEPETGETVLELDDTGGGGIQTSTNAGSASAGSGPGVMTASGTTTQQEVGAAGPDSNRVPAEYRDVVEDYFSEPGSDQ